MAIICETCRHCTPLKGGYGACQNAKARRGSIRRLDAPHDCPHYQERPRMLPNLGTGLVDEPGEAER